MSELDIGTEIAIDKDTVTTENNEKLKNPFFTNNKNAQIKTDLYKTFNRVLILCQVNTIADIEKKYVHDIFNDCVDSNTLNKWKNIFTFVPCEMKIINDKVLINTLLKLERNILEQFTKDLVLNSTELVLCMPFFKKDLVIQYAKLFGNNTKFTEWFQSQLLLSYYNPEKHIIPSMQVELNKMLYQSEECQYWSNIDHCFLSMSELFMQRQFDYKLARRNNMQKISLGGQSTDVTDTLKQLDITMNKHNNYIDFIFGVHIYMDLGNACKNGNKYYYNMEPPIIPMLNKDFVVNLFAKLTSDRDKYTLFNGLLLTKDYCHLVLNNKHILELMQPIINKCMPIYKYIIGYPWLALSVEECKNRKKNTVGNRYVFDLDTASKLPTFPFTSDPHMNPYNTLLIDNDLVQPGKIIGGLKMMVDDHYKNAFKYGIANLEEFRTRFNIFSTGLPNINILDGIVWDGSVCVTGSVIPACCSINPLQMHFERQITPQTLNKFYKDESFYNNSDIDVMCNHDSVYTFIDKFLEIYNTVIKNLATINNLPEEHLKQNVTVSKIKTMCIVVNKRYIYDKFKDQNPDYIIKNIFKKEIKEKFYELYLQIKKDLNEKQMEYRNQNMGKNKYHEDYYEYISLDATSILIADDSQNIKDWVDEKYDTDLLIKQKVVDEKDPKNIREEIMVKFAEGIKYKIVSKLLQKNIEVFRVKNKDFLSGVSQFHLPCVRGFYNGLNCYLLPSCISALMTFMNGNYKYVAGTKDPIEIILKYANRGFGTYINLNEREHVDKYISNVRQWRNIYGSHNVGNYMTLNDISDMHSVNYRCEDHLHKRFDTEKYIETYNDVIEYFKNNHDYNESQSTINYLKLSAINKNGNVEPLKTWVLDEYSMEYL